MGEKTEEQKHERVLGLDVSTKTIGIAMADGNESEDQGELKLLHHVSPKPKNPKPQTKIEELVRKCEVFEEEFLNQYLDAGITKVIVEEPLISARNAYTVATLLKFNGMICKAIYDSLGIVPEFISSYDARANAFPVLMQKSRYRKNGKERTEKEREEGDPVLFGDYPPDTDKKRVIWEFVNEIQPEINWLYKKNGELKKENFDMTDAYAAVWGKMAEEGRWNPLKF